MNTSIVRPTPLGAVRAALLVLPLAFLAAGCGSGSDSPADPGPGNGGTQPPPGGGGPVETTTVTVQDNTFQPGAILVSGGATVTWNWAGSEPHNVTWAGGGLEASPTQTSGSHQVQVPSSGGELVYYCTLHGTPTSGMRGTIVVQ
jgi:plastocyanin